MFLGKVAQGLQVAGTQGLQMAQYQRGGAVAAGQFNLGAGVARLHAAQEFAQRQQQSTDMGRKHGADLHVRHIAAFAFVKPNQHHAFFLHPAHRQARPHAITPIGALNGAQDALGLDLAQMPQVVFHHPLFNRQLGHGVQVLHLATPAGTGMQAKMRASRLHPLRAFMQHRLQSALLPLVFAAVDDGAHPLARQRTLDKHHFALGAVADTLGIVIERLDVEFGQGFGAHAGVNGEAKI